VMETLQNFVHSDRAVVICGNNPAEVNAYFGAPTTTSEEWFKMPKNSRYGLPH